MLYSGLTYNHWRPSETPTHHPLNPSSFLLTESKSAEKY